LIKVSVIVSSYSAQRYEQVIECIGSLKKQTLLPYEIILVLDPDEELRDFYVSRIPSDIRVLVSDAKGLSNTRNSGIMAASGEYIAFIDDDAFADLHWLENLVRNYSSPAVLGVGGLIKPVWQNGRPIWFPEELDWVIGCSYRGLPLERSCVRNPIGCNMSFRKDAFEKAGYFRSDRGRVGTKLMGGEETEFSVRVLRAVPGSRIVYDPSALVYHRVTGKRASLRYLLNRLFHEGVSKELMQRTEISNTLSIERQYLTYLVWTSIPSRLARPWKLKNTAQLFTLLLSILVVLGGYLYSYIQKGLTVNLERAR
jgi:glycosyltransferase involved in cell wall biosynthesis